LILLAEDGTTLWLWLAVAASGLYHGLNPAMGWPLAVAAGLMERSGLALIRALGLLAFGHIAAMALVLLPFSLMADLLIWRRTLQLTCGLLLICWGIYLRLRPAHPRLLARIRPKQLALWSFVIATAHGAGLMLVPIYLGLCRAGDVDGAISWTSSLTAGSLQLALVVSLLHTIAMIAAGGLLAGAAYRILGLAFLSRTWIKLDAVWAASLIVVGAFSMLIAVQT
jgi:hypothetical protein